MYLAHSTYFSNTCVGKQVPNTKDIAFSIILPQMIVEVALCFLFLI